MYKAKVFKSAFSLPKYLPKDYSKSNFEAKGYDIVLALYGAANELAKLANRFIQYLKNFKLTASIIIYNLSSNISLEWD